jgi:hypothetical protein
MHNATCFRALICALLVSLSSFASAAGQYDIRTSAQVVAFGDVHGAYDDWVAMLRELGLVDANLNWSGGDTHLVSLGDLIDRGPGSREVVELMARLDAQAERAGGAVHMVLGNHEVMVMTGDLGYVSAAEFKAFAGDVSASDREALYTEYRRYHPGDEAAMRAEFDRRYPLGFSALRKAYSPQGKLGRWLIQQPFVLKVNDKVYMHGGISGPLSDKSIEDLNTQMRGELSTYLDNMSALRSAGVMPWHVLYQDHLGFLNARAEEFTAANPKQRADWFDPLVQIFEAQKALIFDQEKNPFWYRGSSVCHPYAESFNTERFLKRAGARQLVVGHTPLPGQAQQRMDGLVLRLDTGMLKAVYGGNAAALVSRGGRDFIHYLGSKSPAEPGRESRDLSMQLSGMTDAELEDFLVNAEVVNVEDIGTGITKPKRVTQRRGNVSNDAVFKYYDDQPGMQHRGRYVTRRYNEADRYVHEVAAYRLDRMLDLQMVPTAVVKEVQGDEGVLADWVEKAINERDRLEQDLPFDSFCPQWEQYRLRFVFDILIHNDDRNLTNILWTKQGYMLRFIDHTLAFRTTEKRPKQYRKVSVEISDLLASRLESLDEGKLQSELGPYLHPRQIEGILGRRDLLLKEAVRSGDR